MNDTKDRLSDWTATSPWQSEAEMLAPLDRVSRGR